MTSPKFYEHEDARVEGMLPVSDIHSLYWAEYGSPQGKPVIFVHGGPGGGVSKKNTQFFDPAVYRVVLFEQRGAGRSTPAADVRDNTTQHLISDMEKLRRHVGGVEKWHMVFGGSWGCTLGLAYAQAHPDRVGSLVLRGVFLGTVAEMGYVDVFSTAFFPEIHENYISFLTPEERQPQGGGIVGAYYARLTSGDKATEIAAAKKWNEREMLQSSLSPSAEMLAKLEDEAWLMSHARLEAHYTVNACFLEEDQLIKPENVGRIAHIPTSIVQGRYDLVCPPTTAWKLHKALPQSRLYMIPDAGHDAYEPGTAAKLVEICDEYAQLEV